MPDRGIGMILVSMKFSKNFFIFSSSLLLDTLLLGNYGLSYDQSKAQLAVWAILAAPLLISNDLRDIKPEIKDLLLNRDIIQIDQDPLGIQGTKIDSGAGIEVWARKVLPKVGDEYSYAVAFVSRRTDGHPYAFNATLKDFGVLQNKFGYQVKVRNLTLIKSDLIHFHFVFA
jgi:hypothetical protein